jgi:hypothetical protein
MGIIIGLNPCPPCRKSRPNSSATTPRLPWGKPAAKTLAVCKRKIIDGRIIVPGYYRYSFCLKYLFSHPRRKTEVIIMADLLYLAVALIFFAASWGLIVGCEKLMEE